MRLIYNTTEYPCFLHNCVDHLVKPYLKIEPWDQTQSYNPADTAILTTHVGALASVKWYQNFVDQGFRLVVDHLWDSDVDVPSKIFDNTLILRNKNWIWYRESLYYKSAGYDQYQPRRNYRYKFLMPMHMIRDHRDLAIQTLAPVLDQALYSYVARGRRLPGDIDPSTQSSVYWIYYFNPDWYDSTCFSVVVESYMRSDHWVPSEGPGPIMYRTEVSEKIFKPLAYQHPFVVFGSVDTLKYLKREGFETFSNLWDESYDAIDNDADRHAAVSERVIQIVNEVDFSLGLDALTQEKIAHNHARFFDTALIEKRFVDEIVGDVLRFLA